MGMGLNCREWERMGMLQAISTENLVFKTKSASDWTGQ